MIDLAPHIAAKYRPAEDNDIRAKSYGAVKRTRAAAGGEKTGTLDEQRIFGPLQDFKCACGKYAGREYDGIICHVCGVKIAPATVRRTRCAHINLPFAIEHPVAGTGTMLRVVPVLPASYWESPAGASLVGLYERIVMAAGGLERETAGASFEQIARQLLPVLVVAEGWDLSEATVIAHGAGLVLREEVHEADEPESMGRILRERMGM